MTDPSRGHPIPLHELEAALVRWRALLLIGDLQRRAYLEQQDREDPGEGERLYREFALRMAAENQQLRARVAELESRGDPDMKPNPNQPDRCPSIDPHDELQCGRRIHEDDQCQFGGIGWKKGTPRYVSAEERVAAALAVCEQVEANPVGWGGEMAVSLARTIRAALVEGQS